MPKSNYHKIFALSFVVLLVIVLSIGAPLHPEAAPTGADYVFRRSWGGEGDRLRGPNDVAVGPDRTMYVADYGFNRITAVRPDRTFFTWGASGVGNGEFNEPHGIALDQNGNVYVADTYNNRIQKFSSTGGYITQWGTLGSGNGQFDQPHGVAVDENNHVYVIDTNNNRIQKFTSSGGYVTQWNGATSPGGILGSALGIATDSNNNVYVVTTTDDRVIKFNSNGAFLAEWILVDVSGGAEPRGFDLAVDAAGNVYVVDWGQHVIQKFDANGTYLLSWGGAGTGPGYFWHPEGIAVALDSGGSVAVYVADLGNSSVQIFDRNGNYRTKWGEEAEDGQFSTPGRVNRDQHGNIYVSDTYNHRVQKFNSSGSLQAVLNNQVYQPYGVAVDSTGNIYVIETVGRVKKFNSAFIFLLEWGTAGNGNGEFENPLGIAVDNNDNIYIVDTGNHRIQKFTSTGAYLTQWGSQGAGNGQFDYPHDIAIDASNNIFVTEDTRVQKFTSNGVFLVQWGSPGAGNGQFDYADGIATDTSGNVYVADRANNRVQQFNSNGTYIGQWGSLGNGAGKFYNPSDVVIHDSGNIYILDTGNSRVQMFTASYSVPDPVTGLILNGSFEQATPILNEWTYGGGLPASRVNQGIHGQYALQLAEPSPAQAQGEGQAWIHQTVLVDPAWVRPILSFQYRMFVNDLVDYSDFYVEIQDGVGLNTLATVLRDGFQPCVPNVPPASGTNLGWRTFHYDLTPFKGEYIRLVFYNRNLWSDSWGIWTHVDNARVLDAGPLQASWPQQVFLPLFSNEHCAPIPANNVNSTTHPLHLSLP